MQFIAIRIKPNTRRSCIRTTAAIGMPAINYKIYPDNNYTNNRILSSRCKILVIILLDTILYSYTAYINSASTTTAVV